MRAGELRHIVRLKARGAADSDLDASGQARAVEQDEGWTWAKVRPLGVVERQEAERKYGEATHMITIRGNQLQPTPAKWFVWRDERVARDRVFEIVGDADYDELGVEVRVTCKEAR